MFITFEGPEGGGKSTQVHLLTKVLTERGISVLSTREPGGPPLAESIRKLLLSTESAEMLSRTELLLMAAARAQHTGQWIIPALDNGQVVICDRYYDSTTAYQGAARDLAPETINALREFATFGLVPDVTFLLDLDPQVGLARLADRKRDRMENEGLDFHIRVREGYRLAALAEPERFVVLDATDSPENLHRLILIHTLKKMGV